MIFQSDSKPKIAVENSLYYYILDFYIVNSKTTTYIKALPKITRIRYFVKNTKPNRYNLKTKLLKEKK
jgi:hypothetical protein